MGAAGRDPALYAGNVHQPQNKTSREIALLKEKGYYCPVSVGDYSLNVTKFGNENGKHTFVGLAGLGSGDFSVAARQMTAELEKDDLVVFVDRAGYGFSDDTEHEMTLAYIVEDYRRALKNAGIKAPYILMPHSIGGAYANYWGSTYSEEIEAVVFVDGSQLSEGAFEDEPVSRVNIWDRVLAFLSKLGFSRHVLRDYYYHLPDNEVLELLEKMRQDTIYPYAEKMGNCKVVCLGGDHMIYEQKPEECGKIIKNFIDGLE